MNKQAREQNGSALRGCHNLALTQSEPTGLGTARSRNATLRLRRRHREGLPADRTREYDASTAFLRSGRNGATCLRTTLRFGANWHEGRATLDTGSFFYGAHGVVTGLGTVLGVLAFGVLKVFATVFALGRGAIEVVFSYVARLAEQLKIRLIEQKINSSVDERILAMMNAEPSLGSAALTRFPASVFGGELLPSVVVIPSHTRRAFELFWFQAPTHAIASTRAILAKALFGIRHVWTELLATCRADARIRDVGCHRAIWPSIAAPHVKAPQGAETRSAPGFRHRTTALLAGFHHICALYWQMPANARSVSP